jgi:hypothetical protein
MAERNERIVREEREALAAEAARVAKLLEQQRERE